MIRPAMSSPEDRDADLGDRLRIHHHQAVAFLALVEAIAAKHERRQCTVRRPEVEPEVIEEGVSLYV